MATWQDIVCAACWERMQASARDAFMFEPCSVCRTKIDEIGRRAEASDLQKYPLLVEVPVSPPMRPVAETAPPATWAWTSAIPGAPVALVSSDGIVLAALGNVERGHARLIAAAPEMAALLRFLVKMKTGRCGKRLGGDDIDARTCKPDAPSKCFGCTLTDLVARLPEGPSFG